MLWSHGCTLMYLQNLPLVSFPMSPSRLATIAKLAPVGNTPHNPFKR